MLCSSQSSFSYLKLEHRNSISNIVLTPSNLPYIFNKNRYFYFKKSKSSRYWRWSIFQKTFKYAFSAVCIIFTLDLSQHSEPLASPGVSRENLISQTIWIRFNFCQLFLGVKRNQSIQFRTTWKWAAATPSLYHRKFFCHYVSSTVTGNF